jgi:hypothetical protein
MRRSRQNNPAQVRRVQIDVAPAGARPLEQRRTSGGYVARLPGALTPGASCFRPPGEGYWTEILLGIVQHERRASFYPPRGYRYRLLLSNANKNHVLAIIRRIKIFVLNEPLVAQAIAQMRLPKVYLKPVGELQGMKLSGRHPGCA